MSVKDYSKLTEEERTFEFEKAGKKRKFIYDTDKMRQAQIADANTKFGMYENMVKLLPATLNEFQESMKREVYNRALAALLIEVDPETDIAFDIKYNVNKHPGLEATENMLGLETYQRLEGCKANFFMKQGRISLESIQQLTDIMSELEKQGVNKETQALILETARDGTSEDLEILVESSSKEGISTESTEKKPEPK